MASPLVPPTVARGQVPIVPIVRVDESGRERVDKKWCDGSMRLLVSSAKGTNGNGYGAILSFDLPGPAFGNFSDDHRIVDPRGLCVSPSRDVLHANSGDDRIVALDRMGEIVRATGRIDALHPGGGVFGPDGRYYVGSRRLGTVMALPAMLDGPARSAAAVRSRSVPPRFCVRS